MARMSDGDLLSSRLVKFTYDSRRDDSLSRRDAINAKRLSGLPARRENCAFVAAGVDEIAPDGSPIAEIQRTSYSSSPAVTNSNIMNHDRDVDTSVRHSLRLTTTLLPPE
ncbi:unnamed protein product [Peniophora sp. CBMAI 1063]|nr:unnamed protein product [Peniophora sp. CBMAI 1063]